MVNLNSNHYAWFCDRIPVNYLDLEFITIWNSLHKSTFSIISIQVEKVFVRVHLNYNKQYEEILAVL